MPLRPRYPRAVLDRWFAAMRSRDRERPVPNGGWIRTIRTALGMSTVQFAKRLGVSQSTAVEIEQSEIRGSLQLSTLKRAAEALDCTVMYALVPRTSLQQAVDARTRLVAHRQRAAVDHTMLLEDQRVATEEIEAELDELARRINPRTLWNDP